MIQPLDPELLIEEECPALDIAMPRVYRRPVMPFLQRRRKPLQHLIQEAHRAYRAADGVGFNKAYGQLTSEFNPAIQWALSCWEYLLSTEGCRFLPRSAYEKSYCRGDYRVFTENDYHRLVHKAFKDCLIKHVADSKEQSFHSFLRESFWVEIVNGYRGLENPPNSNQRRLTGYSYLRCAPYQFLNGHHHRRVYKAVKRLPLQLQQVVTLYHLHFYKEEAVVTQAGISLHIFRRRRTEALKRIAAKDRLSCALLTQIERY